MDTITHDTVLEMREIKNDIEARAFKHCYKALQNLATKHEDAAEALERTDKFLTAFWDLTKEEWEEEHGPGFDERMAESDRWFGIQ